MMGGLVDRLRRDERGVSIVEFALLLPVILLLLLGSMTVFDLFRTAQSAEKSAYTVGDMLSRQTAISTSLLNSMLIFVTQTVDFNGTAALRVSSISNNAGKLELDWTRTVGVPAKPLAAIDYAIIPNMASGDSVILTETFIPHRAFVAGFGIDEFIYTNKAVHRPRFVGKIAFQ